MKNLVVFFGGKSVEHDISILTGVMTVNSIDGEKYNAYPVYVDKDGSFYYGEILRDIDNYKSLDYKKLSRVAFVAGSSKLYLLKKNRLKEACEVSLAINCMHGEFGEDGSIIGLIRMCGIACCSPDILPSSVCMSKSFTKIFLNGIKVKTLPSITVTGIKDIDGLKKKIKFPVILKPDLLGSSIGISIANDMDGLKKGIRNALRYGSRIAIEPLLADFTEINCAVYKNAKGELITSPCEKPVRKTAVLSFKDKYEEGERVFPADIDKGLSDKIVELTKKVYSSLMAKGVIRIDYMIKDGEIYLNEINTVPGSLSYYLFSNTLQGFSKMLDEMIEAGLKEYAESLTFVREYQSGILKPFGSKGVKHLSK